jgi:hypothetical protein
VLVFALVACDGGGHHSAKQTSRSGVPTMAAAKTVAGHDETFVVTGTLRAVGGPAPGIDEAVSGNIEALTRTGKVIATVRTSSNGRFSLSLPKGVYVLKGHANSKVSGICEGTLHLSPPGLRNWSLVCPID